MPSDDVSTAGGAIDLLRRIDFTQMASNDTIEAISSSAGDTTQTITLRGRLASGAIVTETITLTGTTQIVTVATYERLLKAELSATCAGTVTVRRATGDVLIRTIPIGERGFMAMFRELASDPSTTVTVYTKIFWKNTHATLALTTSLVKQNADASGKVTHATDASVDASTSVANRVTAPGGLGTFDDTDKAVPGGTINAGSAIGVWYKLALSAGDAALKTTYTSELAGQSV